MGRQGLVFNRDRVQRKIVLAANSLGAAMLGDRRQPLGKVGAALNFSASRLNAILHTPNIFLQFHAWPEVDP
jgi:hypothetical protein